MPRNVEIKANVSDVDELHNLAKKLSTNSGEIINQEDIFFNVPNGRLKLRKILNDKEELIFYDRPNNTGPKLSNYMKVDASPGGLCSELLPVLNAALGIKGTIIKKRTLYMVGQTRVHIDEVKDLGDFMELEVVLEENQTPEDGEKIAKEIMKSLKIGEDSLLHNAYIDMILPTN